MRSFEWPCAAEIYITSEMIEKLTVNVDGGGRKKKHAHSVGQLFVASFQLLFDRFAHIR